MDSENSLEEVLKLAEDYFEISIGIRGPTEQEKTESAEVILSLISGIGDRKPHDRIKIAKYPPKFSDNFLIEIFSTIEYTVFKILSEETDITDGPYIPMLRSEIQFSKQGFETDNLELTLLRQSAFFETYCRMKLERSRQTEWRHLDIESIDTLESGDICQLEKIRNLRGDYAHDWRVYLGQNDDVQLRNMCSTGLGVLARLHKRELVKAYEDNCSQHISQRYPSEWSDRATATIEGNATATLAITCENCSYQFVPEEEDLRYCPQCGISHDYLSRFE